MTKRIAIACQGGGLNVAFAAGALQKILEIVEKDEKKSFEITALSGTSAGALCAFMVWYGLLTGGPQEARERLAGLWADFAAQQPAEQFFNQWVVNTFRLQAQGFLPEVKFSPYSPLFEVLEKQLGFVELVGIRPEFFDYETLLAKNAPRLADIQQTEASVRLLIGAIEVLSGKFKAFDSKKGEVSFAAVRASGAIPWWGIKAVEIDDGVYWDGLLSQNPPLKNFLVDTPVEEKPDEIWLIRINPQEQAEKPIAPEEIEDRRNELAGNLSLNQELDFIEKINEFLEIKAVARLRAFSEKYKSVAVRTIAPSLEVSDNLDTASKLDRSPAFIKRLMADGEKQAAALLAELAQE